MRSAARLTYTRCRRPHDRGDRARRRALYAAYRALLAAREARGTLDLDLPERQVVLREGRVEEVRPRPRYDSHRLIEEFMVLANVAAAEELERLHRPCMYRVHAPPSEEKLEALRTFLHGLGLGLPAGNQIHPRDLDRVLQRVAGTDEAALVNEVDPAQPEPGRNTARTISAISAWRCRATPISPARSGATPTCWCIGPCWAELADVAGLEDTAEHITATERRATLAEREAVDRYLAAFMADKVGATFTARISGVQRFGLFVTLPENGATGLAPMNLLPQDYWVYDESKQSLAGRRTRMTFRLTQEVEVRLIEASPLTGGMLFQVLEPLPQGPRRR